MIAWGVVLLMTLVGCFASRAAYKNGCNDGYGYSKEPLNPGYQDAGRILRSTSAHRWPELK